MRFSQPCFNSWEIDAEKVNNCVDPDLGFAQEAALAGQRGRETEEVCERRVRSGGRSEARSVEKPVGSERAVLFLRKSLARAPCSLVTRAHVHSCLLEEQTLPDVTTKEL